MAQLLRENTAQAYELSSIPNTHTVMLTSASSGESSVSDTHSIYTHMHTHTPTNAHPHTYTQRKIKFHISILTALETRTLIRKYLNCFLVCFFFFWYRVWSGVLGPPAPVFILPGIQASSPCHVQGILIRYLFPFVNDILGYIENNISV